MRIAYPENMTWLSKLLHPVNDHPVLHGYSDCNELPAQHAASPFDLIFLPQEALSTAAALREAPYPFELVFVGSRDALSTDAIRFQPMGHLDSSATMRDLSDIFYRFRTWRDQMEHAYVLQSREHNLCTPYHDILYFSSSGHHAFLHTISAAEPCSHLRRLDDLSEMLPASLFMRCHQRYLVNLDHVVSLDHKSMCLTMDNGMELPVSKRYYSLVCDTLLGRKTA